MRLGAIAAVAGLLLAACPAAWAGTVLDHVRGSSIVRCAALAEPEDYGTDDTHGALPALARDLCRALAAAILGDPDQGRLVFFPDERHGFAALDAGAADVLFGASPLLSAGPLFHLEFSRPVFFDGQSFLVANAAHVATVADLAGKSVCFIAGTSADRTLAAVLGARGIAYRPFPFEEIGEMEAALVDGHCAAMTADLSVLGDARAQFRGRADAFAILPDPITLDPVAPAWSDRDPAWGRMVDVTVSALVAAEQDGITRAAASAAKSPGGGAAQAFLAGDRLAAQVLGLSAGWSLRAVAAVGNYAELFDRDLGQHSPLGLPRGRNALWRAGGLMYPLPMR